MSERHTAGGLQHVPVRTETGAARSAAARGGDGRPFKPYVYKGGEAEPPAVTAARERHQAISARIDAITARLDAARPVPAAAEDVMPDPEPGYEWHRELNHD